VSTQINQIHDDLLKKWPELGSIFSGDSVSVITSVLIIENIDPSCSQNLRLKKMA